MSQVSCFPRTMPATVFVAPLTTIAPMSPVVITRLFVSSTTMSQ
jgi:hypothetical protein